MAVKNERRSVVWNGDAESIENIRLEIVALLDSITNPEVSNQVNDIINKAMDLGAYHYREQVKQFVNGEVIAVIREPENA